MIIQPRFKLSKWETSINFVRAFALEIAIGLCLLALIIIMASASYFTLGGV